ncbi:hypothetical protein HZP42_16125 [Elizabethkingia anophelis]|nr:hypothetical protein [Elizabethkingia anophelis]
MRRTIIFILILSLFYSVKAQKNPVYRYVNIYGHQGMTDEGNFRMMGEQNYQVILKDFEKEFKKVNNGYTDYYRMYNLIGSVKKLTLYVSLIPKELVSEEDKKRKEYRVFGDKRTLEVSYNLKTKKISKPKTSMILYDL